ncbi:MAG: hypothetical protein GTN76_15815 [Candidatus Aenigmarchaeota archaeon]|nr:hypothetical protein [Candidatus Aenigmarchaeota archaeon]
MNFIKYLSKLNLHKILKNKYEIIKDEGEEYATILMKNKLMRPVLPILEDVHGLNRSEYERIGPAGNSSERFKRIVVYKKRT